MQAVDSTPVLELNDLTVRFEEAARPTLAGVSLRLAGNEILGIVGETGAGKSILARAVMDLLPEGARIAGGDVLYRGASIPGMSEEERRRLRGGKVALIGTNAKALLDPVTRVGKQIVRVLMTHRRMTAWQAQKAAVDLLAEVGINEPNRRARAYPFELSGGMAQRVVIAMALVTSPDVILADDATLGLDATVQAQVLDMLVKRARERGVAVMLITHDLGIVRQYCDRVAVMKEGRILEIGAVGPFLKAPHEPYSRKLLEAARARPSVQVGKKPAGDVPLVRVLDLTKHFMTPDSPDPIRAVDGITFSIRRGDTLALVGESGSGKTTAGQCLMHLLPTTDGRIFFDGRDLTDLPERAFRPFRARMQMVFQEPYVALNPRWRVRDLLGEPFRLLDRMTKAERTRRIEELLAAVHLPSILASAFPHELTAGEQKRIGIARALATRPDFVIFDEPTTALDIRVRAQIIDLIRDLQSRTGLTALFITHDLNSVRSLAHNVAVMNQGKIVEQGPTGEIFGAPRDPYTKKLLSAELPIDVDERAPAPVS